MDWAELGLGLLLGQGFLLSVWLALGGLPNVIRFISVLLVTLAGALAVGDERWTIPNWGEWRLDFDPAYHAREKTGRLQVGVVHFLGWTTFLAIPCGIIRLMPREDLAEIATICLSVSAMTLPVAASFSLAVVGRKTWRWTLLAVAAFGVTWTAEVFIPGLVFTENFLLFNLGIVAAVAGNLLVLRLFGLKLFSVVEQPAAVNADRENSVQPPHFQVQPALRPMRPTVEAAGS